MFDHTIISYLNKYAQTSWAFDNSIFFLSTSNLLKGGIFVPVLWWAWFKTGPQRSQNREHIIATITGCIFAISLARTLALLLPFRSRPIHEHGIHFVIPHGMKPYLDGWSAFPSDHAVLFFALSAGILLISKKAGTFSLIYSLLFICAPRVYLGLHYPTDIIGGALIGICIGCIFNLPEIRSKIYKPVLTFSDLKPGFFYPCFFLITYQIAEMFDSVRHISLGVIKLLRNLFDLV